MKLTTLAGVIGLASCSVAGVDREAGSAVRDDRISLYLGQRDLSASDWAPVDEQLTFGVEYAHEAAGSPVGFEVGLMGSGDENILSTDVTGTTAEVYGGIRKTFGDNVVRPYIGGGLSFITAKFEAYGVDDEDSSIAAYAHGGIGIHATDTLVFGLDLRFLFGSDITLLGVNADADYQQLAAFIGIQF